jgi:hypothetical protein
MSLEMVTMNISRPGTISFNMATPFTVMVYDDVTQLPPTFPYNNAYITKNLFGTQPAGLYWREKNNDPFGLTAFVDTYLLSYTNIQNNLDVMKYSTIIPLFNKRYNNPDCIIYPQAGLAGISYVVNDRILASDGTEKFPNVVLAIAMYKIN